MEQDNKFNLLPNETLLDIFSFFNKRDQSRGLSVSKRFYELGKQLKDVPYPDLDYSKILPEKSKLLTVISSAMDDEDMQGVNCIAVLSDKHFVTSTKNGILGVWDLNKAEPIRIFNKHTQYEFKIVYKIIPVSATAFISCGQNGMIYLWDIHQNKNQEWDEPLMTFEDHTTTKGAAVHEALFLKEKNLLATGCSDKTLRIWDVKTGKCLHTAIAFTHDVGFMATFAANLIVSTSNNTNASENNADNDIKLWRLEPDAKLTLLTTLKAHTDSITAFCKLNDKLLATGSGDGTIRIWHIEKSTCIKTIELPRLHQPTCLKRITSRYLGCGIVGHDIEDSIFLYDIKKVDFPFVKSFAGHEYGLLGPNSLVDLENGYFASIDCVDSNIRLWHVDENECLQTIESPENIKELTKLPNGYVISSHFDKISLNIWAFPEHEFKPVIHFNP